MQVCANSRSSPNPFLMNDSFYQHYSNIIWRVSKKKKDGLNIMVPYQTIPSYLQKISICSKVLRFYGIVCLIPRIKCTSPSRRSVPIPRRKGLRTGKGQVKAREGLPWPGRPAGSTQAAGRPVFSV